VSIDEGEPASVVAVGLKSDRLDAEGDEQAGKARVAVATIAMNVCLRGSIDVTTPGERRWFHVVQDTSSPLIVTAGCRQEGRMVRRSDRILVRRTEGGRP